MTSPQNNIILLTIPDIMKKILPQKFFHSPFSIIHLLVSAFTSLSLTLFLFTLQTSYFPKKVQAKNGQVLGQKTYLAKLYLKGSPATPSQITYGTTSIGFDSNGDGTADMLIDSAGNVGIGTTAPGAMLEVSDAAGATDLEIARFINTADTAGAYISLVGDSEGVDYAVQLQADGNGALKIATGETTVGTYGTTDFIIKADGYVGIGTTGPTGVLHVKLPAWTDRDTDSQHAIIGSGTSGYGIRFGYNETSNIGIINVLKPGVSWGNLILGDTVGGYVGIGTTNPGSHLTVAGGLFTLGSDTSTYASLSMIRPGTTYLGRYNRLTPPSHNQVIHETSFYGKNGSGTEFRSMLQRVWINNRDAGQETHSLYWYFRHTGSNDVQRFYFTSLGQGLADTSWTTFSPYLSYNYTESGKTKYDYQLGDIVSLKETERWTVTQATESQNSSLYGVVIHPSGFISIPQELKDETWNKHVEIEDMNNVIPVAHLGEASTKVTLKPGDSISNGTPLTTSNLTGFATKATKTTTILGKALESNGHWNEQSCPVISSLEAIQWPEDDGTNRTKPCFRLPDGTYVGKIMVFVNVSWYDPDVYLTDIGDLSIETSIVDGLAKYELKDKEGNLITRVGAFAEIAVAKIKAGLIETKKLIVDGVDVLEKLNQLSDKIASQQTEIDNLKKEIEELKKK